MWLLLRLTFVVADSWECLVLCPHFGNTFLRWALTCLRAPDLMKTTCCVAGTLGGCTDSGDPGLFRVMSTHACNESFVWRAAVVGPGGWPCDRTISCLPCRVTTSCSNILCCSTGDRKSVSLRVHAYHEWFAPSLVQMHLRFAPWLRARGSWSARALFFPAPRALFSPKRAYGTK